MGRNATMGDNLDMEKYMSANCMENQRLKRQVPSVQGFLDVGGIQKCY